MKTTWRAGIIAVAVAGEFVFSSAARLVTPVAAEPPIKESALPSIAQNWDKNIRSAARFNVLSEFNNEAVRDNNTGLVWEKSPSSTLVNWFGAAFNCVNKTVGGTNGWRLPSVAELASLRDPSLPQPVVPTNIFTGVQAVHYWAATTRTADPGFAWIVPFHNGGFVTGDSTFNPHLSWCVRGPMNTDAY